MQGRCAELSSGILPELKLENKLFPLSSPPSKACSGGDCTIYVRETPQTEVRTCTLHKHNDDHKATVPCVSLFYVNDWLNKVPGAHRGGVPVYTLRLNSGSGHAVLLLTLLGDPMNVGRALGGLMA